MQQQQLLQWPPMPGAAAAAGPPTLQQQSAAADISGMLGYERGALILLDILIGMPEVGGASW